MAETTAELSAEQSTENAGEKARVSPLDPDFICFALPFAIIVDAIDIILELTSVFILPKTVGIIMDIITFTIIGGWIYWRIGRISKSREEQKRAFQKQLAQKSTQMQQQLAKGITKGPLRKTFIRVGATLLGELIPFVGLLPFWTISVILTLREK
ncbi:MAG: hypothetical protein COS26_02010 [Candidatus Nealsonbacteria bacterium CG02_land_8_20_14_3_00_40_11]|uniref:Uncharacterized protein n=1 Tax=Candidatus Nealsonbacteria bacterium CG02_land_8_20_14_3_00_40_11 TaxID=1974700 RepID=A0A2M7D7S0_9BACT|nr:MAG: hypothetical protein COS26_02010 [Candidatus Nealsonbacteria bacterium CG02_land_8_20_14_3_00_40_11]